jgi:hypothetical protein
VCILLHKHIIYILAKKYKKVNGVNGKNRHPAKLFLHKKERPVRASL